ncbi:hypothetical protein HEK616_44830 [Streptomyces nigrescens]|uniref:Cytochrome P450 n=1 Tax=Streptomyces nigrescens TaxID=1920 RepID=A0ABM7ZXB1_STRNI|nr:hypothetical protein HEK616_44830 [Streptomyces nigrescens]
MAAFAALLLIAGHETTANMIGLSADRLDIARPDSRHHVAFGYGIHRCLGQALARVELQVVLGRLLRRFPAMRPAVPVEEIPFRTDMSIYGCHARPVTW